MKLILASSSPRRKELLEYSGFKYQAISPDIDETEIPGEPPEAMVKRLAYGKAEKVAETNADDYVIGADTTVYYNGIIYGKPQDEKDAFRILKELQGETHSVWCGYSLLHKQSGLAETWDMETRVTFAELNDDAIHHYISCGESMDKAGAYAAQGYGMTFVTRIEGSYSNLLGLDLPSLISRLKLAGFKID